MFYHIIVCYYCCCVCVLIAVCIFVSATCILFLLFCSVLSCCISNAKKVYYNRSFQGWVYPGNQLCWCWQPNNTQKHKITNPMTNKLALVKKTHKKKLCLNWPCIKKRQFKIFVNVQSLFYKNDHRDVSHQRNKYVVICTESRAQKLDGKCVHSLNACPTKNI